jgi:hypothetical protein
MMFTVAALPISTRAVCPRSVVSMLGAWMIAPALAPCMVRLLSILTCSVYLPGSIWTVSPPAELAALTAAWTEAESPGNDASGADN